MNRQMRWLVASVLVATTSLSTAWGDDTQTIKALLPAAASMNLNLLMLTDADGRLLRLSDKENHPLSFLVITEEFQNALERHPNSGFGGRRSNDPGAINRAIMAAEPSNQQLSILHSAAITKLAFNSDGNKGTGTVFFEDDINYEGQVDFVARKRRDGKWQIEEFNFPKLGVKTELSPSGHWKATITEPKRKE